MPDRSRYRIANQPEDYLHSSTRNYIQLPGCLLDITVLDFGVQEGFVPI